MIRPRRRLWLGAAVLALVGGAVPFEGHPQEMPCTEEIRTLCADVQPGGGRIMRCLKANEAKLSMACAQRLHELQEAMSGLMGACRDDWVAYCYHPRASTGRQDMMQCLRTNQANVSAGCQKALQGMGGMQRSRGGGTMR
jgi:hypothetical protein